MPRVADPAVRAALIEAAAERLATEGLDALSLRRVAADVGSSTQAVYTHFGSKEDLVRAVVVEAFARLTAELAGVPATDDPLADLAELAQAYRRNARTNAHLYRVMFGLNPLALAEPADHLTATHGIAEPATGIEAFQVLAGAAGRAVDGGLLAGDAGEIAVSLWAAAHGAVSLELAGFLGPSEVAAAAFARATQATFAGLARQVDTT